MLKSCNVHGCAILLKTTGLLIRGPSGSGKTRLARSLINQWKQQGKFSQWIGDDQLELRFHEDAIIAQAPETIIGLAEHRYCGIETICHVASGRLDVVVDLVPQHQLERLPDHKFVKLLKNAPLLNSMAAPANNNELAIEIVQGYLRKMVTGDKQNLTKNVLQVPTGM